MLSKQILSKQVPSLKRFLKYFVLFVAYKFVRVLIRWGRNVRHLRKLSKNSEKIEFAEELGATPASLAINIGKNLPRIHHYRLSLFKKYTNNFSNSTKTLAACGSLLDFSPVFFTIDPILVKHVFKDRVDNYLKVDFGFEQSFGKNLLTAQHGPHAADKGKLFTFQRKTASKIFTKRNLHGFTSDCMKKHLRDMYAGISELSSDGTATEVPLKEFVFQFAFRVISQAGFGKEYKDAAEANDYASTFENYIELVLNAFSNPIWQLPLSEYYVPGKKKYMRLRKKLNGICYEMVDKRLASEGKASGDEQDLMSLYMKIARDTEFGTREMLKDFSILFLAAGTHTSSHSMQYAILYLGKHLKLQEDLREEILKFSKFDPETHEFDVDMNKMKECKLLDAILLETMRLHAVVGFNGRQAVEDDVLPDGSFVSKGTVILYDAFTMAYDPNLYDNPSEFDPTRWMSEERGSESFDDTTYLTFASGKRKCMGQSLAFHEMKFFVTYFVNVFAFELSQKEKDIIATQEGHYSEGQIHNYKNKLLVDLKFRY
eukprot:snap_masked-scaffold_120-processed-gene-0.21-mRNA-1 protein AED:0.69 eAED:0.69 QI:0/-1/0/1/-1/1/1/0/542